MRRSARTATVTLDVLADAVIIAVSYLISFLLIINSPEASGAPYPGIAAELALLVSVAVGSMFALGVYRQGTYRVGAPWARRILLAGLLHLAIEVFFISVTATGGSLLPSCLGVFIGFGVSTLLLLLKRTAEVSTLCLIWRAESVRRALIVADRADAIECVADALIGSADRPFSVIGYVGDGDLSATHQRLGDLSELRAVLERYRPDEVILALDQYGGDTCAAIIKECEAHPVGVLIFPMTPHGGDYKADIIGGVPFARVGENRLDDPLRATFKRAFDIVGAVLLLILTSPIMLIAAVGVVISSPGPIIFSQERVGKGGRLFRMYKLRSMVVNERADGGWTVVGDPRRTRFGAFLRMSAIDELPQLFNVLRGDMSLVGPRPEQPHFVERFKDEVPQYMRRHTVKPGITGLAQVRGLRGDTSLSERVRADIEYIENWSMRLDLGILLLTPLRAINSSEKYIAERTDSSSLKQEDRGAAAECSPKHRTGDENRDMGGDGCLIRARSSDDSEEKKHRTETPKSGKRVLYAASTAEHIRRFHEDYIKALSDLGYEVKILARGGGVSYNLPFEKKWLSVSNLFALAGIRQILKRERFDIILLNTTLASILVRLCLPRRGRPRVVNFVHGYLFDRGSSGIRGMLLRLAERMLASRTDAVITMNNADYLAAKQGRLALCECYKCRGTGVSLGAEIISRESLRRALGVTDCFVLCFVGELSRRKNQHFLILAMNYIKEKIPNAVLLLVGGGRERVALERLVERFGLQGDVRLIGERDNPCDYMRASDLYVTASSSEGLPHNLLEAMGCARTVLASRIKGHVDIIDDGKNGFLYRPSDMDDFLRTVMNIYSGRVNISRDDIISTYKRFSKDNVFDDTLETIKRSFVN